MSVSAFIRRRVLPSALAVIAAGCSVDKTELPALSGPSELGLSITLLANPDVLAQDGASQSQIVVQVRNANGQPARDVPVRAEISVGGVAVDFGRLSARTVVTGPDGRAVLTYTAPPPPPEPVDRFTIVTILVIPSGTDFSNAVARSVDIRLVPTGVILPPNGTPLPDFTFSQPATQNTPVQFDASPSRDDGQLVSYAWDFGDGSSGTGLRPVHVYEQGGSYSVTLTVTDDRGLKASVTKVVAVTSTPSPSAAFTVSPGSPGVNDLVTFNASGSLPASGRRIVDWRWTFGDGAGGGGQVVTHRYAAAGAYNVTLTVTDDAGKTATASQAVTVGAGQQPSADFVFSPETPAPNQIVNFDASVSAAPPGRTIRTYEWNFGDGTFDNGPQVRHAFTTAGVYNVLLTVTDSAGAKATRTRAVTVR